MRHLLRLLTVAALGMLLAGASCQKRDAPRPGSEHDTVVEKFKPLDPELLVDCPVAEGPLREVINVAKLRKDALEECNRRWAKVRALQPIED
jgi:hypothetical protein